MYIPDNDFNLAKPDKTLQQSLILTLSDSNLWKLSFKTDPSSLTSLLQHREWLFYFLEPGEQNALKTKCDFLCKLLSKIQTCFTFFCCESTAAASPSRGTLPAWSLKFAQICTSYFLHNDEATWSHRIMAKNHIKGRF